MIDPKGPVGKSTAEVRGSWFGSSGSDEDISDVAVAITKDIDGGVGASCGVCCDGLEGKKKDKRDDA
jgi:hypothetical protein